MVWYRTVHVCKVVCRWCSCILGNSSEIVWIVPPKLKSTTPSDFYIMHCNGLIVVWSCACDSSSAVVVVCHCLCVPGLQGIASASVQVRLVFVCTCVYMWILYVCESYYKL